MKHRTIFIIAALVSLLGVRAQELTVKGMTVAGMDLSASTYQRSDNTGNPCGLVKVQLAAEGAAFSGNVLGEVTNHEGEYWVYMSEGSYLLQVRHPKFLPLDVNFRDYGISGVQGKTTYKLTLLMPQGSVSQTQKLTINYTPKNAVVVVDSKAYTGNGRVELTLPVGSHEYQIVAGGYDTAEGSVKLNASSPRTITENLVASTQSAQPPSPVVQQTAPVQQPSTVSQTPAQSSSTVPSASTQAITVKDATSSNIDLSVRIVRSFKHVSGPAVLAYGIVTGSFGLLKNAESHAKKLKSEGYNPTIIHDHNEMYRVIVTTTNDKAEAASQNKKIKKSFSSCWVMYNPKKMR